MSFITEHYVLAEMAVAEWIENMTISVGGFPRMSPIYPTKSSPPVTASANARVQATTSMGSGKQDQATISPAALALAEKATTSAPVLNEAYYDTIRRLPEQERLAETAKQADAISASQGLPPGKYDYTHMSVGQMMTVMANMVGNLGYQSDHLSAMWNIGFQKPDGGTSFGSSIDWTTPRNVLGELTRDYDRLVSAGDFVSATIYNLSILAMKSTSVIAANN